MTRQLVLLKTAGNQRFILATNRLRENVGASELTYRVGKTWVWDAVHLGIPESDQNESDISVNPPLGPGVPVQIILATSGKAYLLADTKDTARNVIRKVTTAAIKKAPGIDLSGVFVPFEYDENRIDDAIKAAHKKLAARRGTNPGPEARFQRLPVVAECATSGLPAAEYENTKTEPGPRSAQSIAKRKASGAGINRMRKIARDHSSLGIVYSVDDLERGVEPDLDHLDAEAKRSWLAVVHADGNGLGKVFLNFRECAKATDDNDYIVKLQSFSRTLDLCTEKAFGYALTELHRRCSESPLPVVPIVLGGDDMTVVMDGRYAIQFTIDYLKHFEELTGKAEVVKAIVGKAVTACAGVAVVSPHFPFYAAYELAEELIKSAKEFAKPRNRSAFDFHILYDASGPDLKRIRESLTLESGVTHLVARPYLISMDDAESVLRSTAALQKRMAAIHKTEDGRRAIPNSQLHDLRTALFLGKDAAEARYGLVRRRYDKAFAELLPDGLFWKDDGAFRTHLMDAIDLFDFWENE